MYVPLNCKSFYSLQLGLSHPKKLIARAQQIESNAIAMTDFGASGSVQFTKSAGDIKPILGSTFHICGQHPEIKDATNNSACHLPLLCQSKRGWSNLIELISKSNIADYYYNKPRLNLDIVANHSNELIAYSGHKYSHIFQAALAQDWESKCDALISKFKSMFGDRFYLAIDFPSAKHQVADKIRQLGKKYKIGVIGVPNAYYTRQEDSTDQRILLCSKLRTTLKQASSSAFHEFFDNDSYYIPTESEMRTVFSDSELKLTNEVSDRIENFSILNNPVFPEFKCPNGISPSEYLRELCREGFKSKINGTVDESLIGTYVERVKYELGVLQEANLDSYFLMVRDILEFVRSKNWLVGVGRGSSMGCLVSYLVDITQVDPIPYDLLFTRFYNKGRNTETHKEFPDIDIDVPRQARRAVYEYLQEKYGKENVGQMVTFQTMKGRNALKEVFRAYGGISFEEMNDITKNIIEEHKISDKLQEMKDEFGESSIIRWCLENKSEEFKNWCTIDEAGNLSGPLAARFQQAMRLEGIKIVQSRHPAGIVITPTPLNNICPMALDQESKNLIAALEMDDLASVGGIKLDVLGLSTLDKIMGVANDLRGRSIDYEFSNV